MCNYPNCKIRPTYKVEGKKALYCAKHKMECIYYITVQSWEGGGKYDVSNNLLINREI